MAGEPAITKIVTAFAALLTAGLPGQQIFTNRDSAEPLDETERPGIVVRVTEQQFTNFELGMGETLHSAALELDLYESAPSLDTITSRHAVTIATIVSLIHANADFKKMLQECEPQAASGIEEDVADVGATVFAIAIKFLTPSTDWTKIIGHAGIID